MVFFSTWCGPCVAELPKLTEFEERWGASGYRLVLVAPPLRQSVERLAQFNREQHPPGELMLDTDGRSLRALGIDRIPTHVVLDSEGREACRAGFLDGAVEEAVEKLLENGASASRRSP